MQESEVLSLGSAGKQKLQTKDGKIKQEANDAFYFSNRDGDSSVDERKLVVRRFDHGGRYYSLDQNDIVHRLKFCADQIVYNRLKFSKVVGVICFSILIIVFQNHLDSNSLSVLPTTSLKVLNEVKVFHTFMQSSGLTDYIDATEIVSLVWYLGTTT